MAGERMVTPHEARVLNLIAKVDIRSASAKKRQIIHLLKKWPNARRIRFSSKCHCRRGLQLSFALPEFNETHTFDGELYEDCGFYCPHCGFGNAGARPVKEKKL